MHSNQQLNYLLVYVSFFNTDFSHTPFYFWFHSYMTLQFCPPIHNCRLTEKLLFAAIVCILANNRGDSLHSRDFNHCVLPIIRPKVAKSLVMR